MPWEYQLSESLRDISILVFLAVLTYMAVRMGRQRRRHHVPDELGRKVEDFAGITGESNGPLPWFLILIYIAVALFWILYTINVVINGYRY